MGHQFTLTASDAHTLGAYRADPAGTSRGGIVVIQEIFGVNGHIRSVCDRFAAEGYVAVAPAIFDRSVRDFTSGYSHEEVEKARDFAMKADFKMFLRDTEAAIAELAPVGPVGIVGFCLGGTVAFLSATRLSGLSAAVGYYGGGVAKASHEVPKCPVQLHFGAKDPMIPLSDVDTIRAARPDVEVFVYNEAGHGFNCDERASYHAPSAGLAWGRTTAFLAKHMAR